AGEFRDNETGMHVIRVSHFARALAAAFGLNDVQQDMIYTAILGIFYCCEADATGLRTCQGFFAWLEFFLRRNCSL
ncbi:MAG: hypothetical protein QNL04_14350, partial [SAR324 cluster bacterium]|nr:hypothetical protein [SAR324 cluster bacterium]